MPSTPSRKKKKKTVAAKRRAVTAITPDLQRTLTMASVAALQAFIETWDAESPETIPQPLRIMHEVMHQLGERQHG